MSNESCEVATRRRVSSRSVPSPTCGLLGESSAIAQVRARIERFAGLRQPVLVRGETGTGKEVVAQALHACQRGRMGSLVTVNCGAIPDNLAESELFGHERGAFSGASRHHRGAFSRAHQGTLFLDEIGELPLHLQAKLLRVLESGVVVAVGSEREEIVNVRVIAATHRDLWQMVADGSFREDLLHRLSVLEIHLPALRERPSDIPLLLRHFAELAAQEVLRPVEISPAAVAAACTYPWPGNVRALKNAITRAAILHEGPITADDLLPPEIRMSKTSSPLRANDNVIQIPRGDYATMRRALLDAILLESGSLRKAARALNVPRSTLGNWLKPAPTLT